MEPIETQNPAAPGSIADTVARLLLWSRRAPKGLARVEFTSEFARQRVVDSLRAALEEAGIAFHEIELPTRTPAGVVARQLVEQLRRLEPGVVSLTGFATAFPDDIPLADSLGIFNFHRENLAGPPLRQIWWMTPSFADNFIRTVPDLASWFMVRLRLTETVQPEETGLETFTLPETSYLPLDEARKRSAYLVERFENALKNNNSTAELLNLLVPAVKVLNEAGAVKEAGELVDALLEKMARAGKPLCIQDIASNTNYPENIETATSLNDLASLYNDLGRYALAEPLYQRALAIREKILGSEHPDTARSLNNLANLYNNLGRYALAEPLYQRALAIWEKTLGPEHPTASASLNNLANLYTVQHRYAEAEPLYQHALAIREKTLGPVHPYVAQSLDNLAVLYGTLGRYTEAEPLFKRALAIREKVMGPEHPTASASLNNLANLYNAQGRYAKAEPLIQRGLEIMEQRLGLEHPYTVMVRNNYAGLLRKTGRQAEAEAMEARAGAVQEKTDHIAKTLTEA